MFRLVGLDWVPLSQQNVAAAAHGAKRAGLFREMVRLCRDLQRSRSFLPGSPSALPRRGRRQRSRRHYLPCATKACLIRSGGERGSSSRGQNFYFSSKFGSLLLMLRANTTLAPALNKSAGGIPPARRLTAGVLQWTPPPPPPPHPVPYRM